MDSFFGVRARNVKEFYRIVGFLKPIVYICVKENKGVLQIKVNRFFSKIAKNTRQIAE